MSEDELFDESDSAVVNVPYLPPLASYRVQIRWGEVREIAPMIFPEDDVQLDEIEE